jgi:cytochrome c oxidase subunit 3
MAGQSVGHDYHLVEPSAWPLIASISVFVMLVGTVMWMTALFGGGWYVAALGAAGLIFVMIGWWRDVINEHEKGGHHTPVVQLHHRYAMILFIASEVMFFVAWFWAYFNASLFPDQHNLTAWPPEGIQTFDPWHLPFLNTLILLTSGTTVTWAHHALVHGNRKGFIQGLWLTILLGITFSCVQFYEYSQAAFPFGGPDANIYGSTFYMATGFHGAHVIIGTIFLIVNLIRAYAGHFKDGNIFGFEAAAWYWHFVDVVWLFLFVIIYVGGQGAGGGGH